MLGDVVRARHILLIELLHRALPGYDGLFDVEGLSWGSLGGNCLRAESGASYPGCVDGASFSLLLPRRPMVIIESNCVSSKRRPDLLSFIPNELFKQKIHQPTIFLLLKLSL